MNSKKLNMITHFDLDGLSSAAIFEIAAGGRLWGIEAPQNIRGDYKPPVDQVVYLDLPSPVGVANIDHHVSNPNLGVEDWEGKKIYVKEAPSAAHLVWELFGGVKLNIIRAVNKVDCADYTKKDFRLTGDGVYKSSAMNLSNALSPHRYNFDLLMNKYYPIVKDWVLTGQVPEEIVTEAREVISSKRDAYERVEKKWMDVGGYKLLHITAREGDFIDPFLAYIEGADILCIHSLKTGNFHIGWNVFKKDSCPINVGKFCLAHGGGGHPTVGGCPFSDGVFNDLIRELEVR